MRQGVDAGVTEEGEACGVRDGNGGVWFEGLVAGEGGEVVLFVEVFEE